MGGKEGGRDWGRKRKRGGGGENKGQRVAVHTAKRMTFPGREVLAGFSLMLSGWPGVGKAPEELLRSPQLVLGLSAVCLRMCKMVTESSYKYTVTVTKLSPPEYHQAMTFTELSPSEYHQAGVIFVKRTWTEGCLLSAGLKTMTTISV